MIKHLSNSSAVADELSECLIILRDWRLKGWSGLIRQKFILDINLVSLPQFGFKPFGLLYVILEFLRLIKYCGCTKIYCVQMGRSLPDQV